MEIVELILQFGVVTSSAQVLYLVQENQLFCKLDLYIFFQFRFIPSSTTPNMAKKGLKLFP